MTALQDRAGKNASPKPYWFENATYGSHRSYVISQSGGVQLLIPGPPAPGSGSKNLPPRAQNTEGQGDLENERYMGARSRAILTPLSENLGIAYGKSGRVVGDIVFVRPNGKAIKIGTLDVDPGASDFVSPGVYDIIGAFGPPSPLGSLWCLAPGEDIVFVPNTGSAGSSAGETLWVPNFIDSDLICHRTLLTTAKQTVLEVPPGKAWFVPPAFLFEASEGPFPSITGAIGLLNLTPGPVDYSAYINPGNGDVLFASAETAAAAQFTQLALGGLVENFFLPAGHQIKVALEDEASDVFFAAVVAEVNQAEEMDESFATPVVIPPPP